MEPTVQPHQPISSPQVSFPQPREPEGKSKSLRIIIAVIGVILIVLVGGWFILGNNNGTGTATPSPSSEGLSSFPTPETTRTPSPTPSASPSASPKAVDKSAIKVEVLNGTGIPGEAGFLQTELKKLGFTDITAGNADQQDQTETIVTYSRDLSADVADELTAKLEELYTTVKTRKATLSGDFDISITTGPRKAKTGASASPTASTSAKSSGTPKPTTSPTATP